MNQSEPTAADLTPEEIRRLARYGLGVEAIRRRLGLDRRTAHRLVDRVRQRLALEAPDKNSPNKCPAQR